jgi:hypothetical protein
MTEVGSRQSKPQLRAMVRTLVPLVPVRYSCHTFYDCDRKRPLVCSGRMWHTRSQSRGGAIAGQHTPTHQSVSRSRIIRAGGVWGMQGSSYSSVPQGMGGRIHQRRVRRQLQRNGDVRLPSALLIIILSRVGRLDAREGNARWQHADLKQHNLAVSSRLVVVSITSWFARAHEPILVTLSAPPAASGLPPLPPPPPPLPPPPPTSKERLRLGRRWSPTKPVSNVSGSPRWWKRARQGKKDRVAG